MGAAFKRFSLATLLLLITIAALVVGLIVMGQRHAEAQAEVEEVRRKYGHIRVLDSNAIYVSRVEEYEQGDDAYRLRIPPGHHYLIHITETTFPSSAYPDDPIPSQTISLNGWRDGADVVLSYAIQNEGDGRRLVVHTETEQFFDYPLANWDDGNMPDEAAHLQTQGQRAISPDQTIRFMWFRNRKSQRGVMLWMEPIASWESRRAKESRD